MAKKELEEQLKSYEDYINDTPLVIAPCKMCKTYKKKDRYKFGESYDTGHFENNGEYWVEGACKSCCWFYDSKFEIGIDDNSCATCRHKAKMLTDKKPCKDCDNGCNWEK